jgi:hypothetical protein
MAIDAGPFRRQLMNQVSVAMVANVESVEFTQPISKMPRIIPEAVQKPVGIECCSLSVD